MVKNKCIFIDRDGVINRSKVVNGKPFAPLKFSEFIFLPKVKKAVDIFKNKKFITIIISNQPDISKKKLKFSELNKMNQKLLNYLKIDDIFICTHSKEAKCSCRKPKVGLFKKAIKKYSIDIKSSYMIGDRKIDIDAGNKLNLKTIFIDKNYREDKPINFDYRCKSLYKSLNFIK